MGKRIIQTPANQLPLIGFFLGCFGLIGTLVAQNPPPLPLPELPPAEMAPSNKVEKPKPTPAVEKPKPAPAKVIYHEEGKTEEPDFKPSKLPPDSKIEPKPLPLPVVVSPPTIPVPVPVILGSSGNAPPENDPVIFLPEIPRMSGPLELIPTSVKSQAVVPDQKPTKNTDSVEIPILPPVAPPELKSPGQPSLPVVPSSPSEAGKENETSDPPPAFQPLISPLPLENPKEFKPAPAIPTENSKSLKPAPEIPVENSKSLKPAPKIPEEQPPVKPVPQPKVVNYAGPVIVIDQTGASTGLVGDTLKYEIIVRNQGGSAAKNIMVTKIIPAGAELVQSVPPAIVQKDQLTWRIDSLDPNQEKRLESSFRALTVGELRLESSAYLRVSHKGSTTKIVERPIKMQVQNATEFIAGQKVPVKISIANQSEAALKELMLFMTIPEGLKHPVGNEIEAELPAIDPGKTKVIDVNLEAVKPGRFAVDILVKTPGGDKMVHQASILVKEMPGLLLKKIGVPVLVKGKVNEYRLEIINQSGYDAKNVVVTEHISDGIDFIAASDRGIYNPKTKTIQWLLGTIHPGQSRAIGLKLQGKISGESQNKVTAEATGGIRVDLSASLIIQDAELPPGPIVPAPTGPLGFLQPIFGRK